MRKTLRFYQEHSPEEFADPRKRHWRQNHWGVWYLLKGGSWCYEPQGKLPNDRAFLKRLTYTDDTPESEQILTEVLATFESNDDFIWHRDLAEGIADGRGKAKVNSVAGQISAAKRRLVTLAADDPERETIEKRIAELQRQTKTGKAKEKQAAKGAKKEAAKKRSKVEYNGIMWWPEDLKQAAEEYEAEARAARDEIDQIRNKFRLSADDKEELAALKKKATNAAAIASGIRDALFSPSDSCTMYAPVNGAGDELTDGKNSMVGKSGGEAEIPETGIPRIAGLNGRPISAPLVPPYSIKALPWLLKERSRITAEIVELEDPDSMNFENGKMRETSKAILDNRIESRYFLDKAIAEKEAAKAASKEPTQEPKKTTPKNGSAKNTRTAKGTGREKTREANHVA